MSFEPTSDRMVDVRALRPSKVRRYRAVVLDGAKVISAWG